MIKRTKRVDLDEKLEVVKNQTMQLSYLGLAEEAIDWSWSSGNSIKPCNRLCNGEDRYKRT